MSALSAPTVPLSALKPAPATGFGQAALTGMDETTKRAQIDAKAKEYEATFLSIMFGQMFEGTSRTLFGGGPGEEAFTGFLTDAMAKQVSRHGGVGLAKNLAADMLKMQGLAPLPSPLTSAKSASAPKAASPSQISPSQARPPQPPTVDIAA